MASQKIHLSKLLKPSFIRPVFKMFTLMWWAFADYFWESVFGHLSCGSLYANGKAIAGF